MIIHLSIGAMTAIGLLLIVEYARRVNLRLSWWHWLLTVMGFIYATIVFELVVAFLSEGSTQAALTVGGLSGLLAAVWGVLLVRFVFSKAKEIQ